MHFFLQAFIYLDIFIIGYAAAVAARHAYAHYHPQPHEEKPGKVKNPSTDISNELKAKISAETEEKYRKIMETTGEHLTKELSATMEKINAKVDSLAGDVIEKEISQYRQLIKDYEVKAQEKLNQTDSQTSDYEAKLRLEVEKAVNEEKAKRLASIDAKLADLILSFLNDSLRYEVDLGSQTKYLLSTLEANKQELKKALNE